MITSKYNFKGGFLLLVAMILIGFVLLIIAPIKLTTFYLYFVTFQSLLLLLFFMKECRFIRIDHEKIVYTNPVLPFLKKTKYFHDYDYFHTVEERSRSNSYETIWLIKNKVLVDRISSFYYSNYSEMKQSIPNNKGPLSINSFKQIACRFGMEI